LKFAETPGGVTLAMTLRRFEVAHRGLQQVDQLEPELPDVDALGDNQAEVEWQLKPPTHEDQLRKRAQARIAGRPRGGFHAC